MEGADLHPLPLSCAQDSGVSCALLCCGVRAAGRAGDTLSSNDLLPACVSFTSEVGVLIKFGGLLPGAEEEDLLVSG